MNSGCLHDDVLESLLESAHLRYIDDYSKGYRRLKKGKSFRYKDAQGKTVQDKNIINRINALVLPPAWSDVWICFYKNGHLQATGIDAAGRKQYRYHDKWSELKNQSKFDNLIGFGEKLARLRRQLRKDLQLKQLDKQKAVAIALSILDDTYIRVGNHAYEQKYGSYGLTTLKNRHVSIKGAACFFRFRGKKGVAQKKELTDKELIKLLKKIKEIPGQMLFQYYQHDNTVCPLGSGDINDYLKAHMGEGYTCKDFRTWAGTVMALNYMVQSSRDIASEKIRSKAKTKKKKPDAVEILNKVAEELGNTRSVTKKYYVHPDLLTAYENQTLMDTTHCLAYCRPKALYKTGEKELIYFLKYLNKKRKKG